MNRSELIHRGWHERSIYATDASMYREVPSGIAAPRDGEELQRIVAEPPNTTSLFWPVAGILAGGANCGARGGARFSRHMHQLLSLDPNHQSAWVQPGLVLDELNRQAAAHGLLFGPDVSTSTHATLGGMIANRSLVRTRSSMG